MNELSAAIEISFKALEIFYALPGVAFTLRIVAIIAALPIIFFLVRLMVLGPHAAAHIEADGTKGFFNRAKGILHYLYNPTKLKTIYLRDGKCSYKPVFLAFKREEQPSGNDKQS